MTDVEKDDLVSIDIRNVAQAGEHWLVLFDKFFAEQGMPFHQRPLRSAIKFVEIALVDVPGGSKDEFWKKEWFTQIAVSIGKWYKNRYGSERMRPVPGFFKGLVLLLGTPVELNIRETVNRVEIEGETAWMIYPSAIHESEEISSFFSSKPNIQGLSRNQRLKLEANLSDVVKMTRQINQAVTTADELNADGVGLRNSIWVHMDRGISDVASLDPSRASVGTWEFHLALEKTFKVLLHQRGIQDVKDFGHDINMLRATAASVGITVDQRKTEKIPHWKVAANRRYGESILNPLEGFNIYRSVLEIIYDLSKEIKRSVIISDAELLLRKAPWA